MTRALTLSGGPSGGTGVPRVQLRPDPIAIDGNFIGGTGVPRVQLDSDPLAGRNALS